MSTCGRSCICDFLFKDFEWVDLATTMDSALPKRPGIYALRLNIGENEDSLTLRNKILEAYNIAMSILKKANWRRLTKYWGPRIERIKRIDPLTCPIIYIGGTGKGEGTIRSRFADLAGWRHTIFPCILALRLAGWNIHFGYRTVNRGEEAFKMEEKLIRQYMEIHGTPPALNKKVKLNNPK